MENKSEMTIEQIIKGEIEFNFGNVQQAIIDRKLHPLSHKESSELLKVAKLFYQSSLQKIIDPLAKSIRVKEIEQTIENIQQPFYWNLNTPFKSIATDSIRHFCLASADMLKLILAEHFEYKEQKVEKDLDHKKNILNQEETAIFFQLLINLNIINPDLNKRTVAKYITSLTGYQTKQMINGLSFDIHEMAKNKPQVIEKVKKIISSLESMLPDTQA